MTGAEGILNGNEVKEIIKDTIKNDVQTKFNETDFLSSQNLDTKIAAKLPDLAQKFFENGGMNKYIEKIFNISGEDFPQDLTQKPRDFTIKFEKFGTYNGYAALGQLLLTGADGKKLFLKDVDSSYANDKPVKVILTTDPTKAAKLAVTKNDLSGYVLQAGEYEAEVQGYNTYASSYYSPYEVLKMDDEGASYYSYFMLNDNTKGFLKITIKNFYPKTVECYNGSNDRYTHSFVVKLFDGDKCYYNRKFIDLVAPRTKVNVNIPKFD